MTQRAAATQWSRRLRKALIVLVFLPAVWIASPIVTGNVARAEQRIPIGHGQASDTLVLTDPRTWSMRQAAGSFWQFSDPDGLFSVFIPSDWVEVDAREPHSRLAIERQGHVDTRCAIIAAPHGIELSEHAARSMAEIFVTDGSVEEFPARFGLPYHIHNQQLIIVAERSHYFMEVAFESSGSDLVPAFRLFEAGALTAEHFWKILCSEVLDSPDSSISGLQALLSTLVISR